MAEGRSVYQNLRDLFAEKPLDIPLIRRLLQANPEVLLLREPSWRSLLRVACDVINATPLIQVILEVAPHIVRGQCIRSARTRSSYLRLHHDDSYYALITESEACMLIDCGAIVEGVDEKAFPHVVPYYRAHCECVRVRRSALAALFAALCSSKKVPKDVLRLVIEELKRARPQFANWGGAHELREIKRQCK